MAFRMGYLRTRVARRILLLFVVGAMVPVLFMAGASFRAMSQQLRGQSEERLRQVSRNARQAVMQQLLLTESRVRLASESVTGGGPAPARSDVHASLLRLQLQEGAGSPTPLLGPTFDIPALGTAESAHLARGEMLLHMAPGSEAPIVAGLRVGGQGGDGRILWAVVEGDSIWGTAERFASGGSISDFCVLTERDPLYCRSGLPAIADAFLAAGIPSATSGSFTATAGGEEVVLGHAELFMEAAFSAPLLHVVVSEDVDALYSADVSLFRYSFAVALVLGLLLVALLASIQVRRTMTPLEALTEGTTRLADGDLDARVEVETDDEFGVLARSFNTMARRLGIQFRALEVGRAVDRAVLSALDVAGVVDALLEHFRRLVSCRSLAVLVVTPGQDLPAVLFHGHPEAGGRRRLDVDLDLSDRHWLAGTEHRVVEDVLRRPGFLQDVPGLGPRPLVVFPLRTQGTLLGAVIFEAEGEEAPGKEVIGHARQVADQATVALDAVRLVGELEEMNWGTLRALARAIDAKSRWTAGHSERVTELALRIARAMGLPEAELEVLRRGGLLHDVGKIGVPAHVLDQEEGLGPREWAMIREHPTIGGRILEPIRAFAPALPIVLQHHERWDGLGYPAGLAGTEIHPLARILAVADTYDAMASPRPYREALDQRAVLAEIRQGSGTQFEPSVVRVFLEVMAGGAKAPTAVDGGHLG